MVTLAIVAPLQWRVGHSWGGGWAVAAGVLARLALAVGIVQHNRVVLCAGATEAGWRALDGQGEWKQRKWP